MLFANSVSSFRDMELISSGKFCRDADCKREPISLSESALLPGTTERYLLIRPADCDRRCLLDVFLRGDRRFDRAERGIPTTKRPLVVMVVSIIFFWYERR